VEDRFECFPKRKKYTKNSKRLVELVEGGYGLEEFV
jgi:hypothetical protein